MSQPFPKGFPRGGGVYDQDPLLMKDFRMIRKFELDWKDSQRKIEEAKSKLGNANHPTGGGFNLEELVDQLAEAS